jgi:hypothetical protein
MLVQVYHSRDIHQIIITITHGVYGKCIHTFGWEVCMEETVQKTDVGEVYIKVDLKEVRGEVVG